jgi:hypothetical protein
VAEDEYLPAFDGSPAGDHPVATDPPFIHVEIGRPVQGEHVELGERTGVEHPVDALTRGELALGVLRALGGAGPVDRVVPAFAQHIDLLARAAAGSTRRCSIRIRRCGGAGGSDRIARADRWNAFARLSGHGVRLPGDRMPPRVHTVTGGR